MMPRTPQGQQAAAQQNIATYKAFTLEPGSQYEVYVSYVTDGPCNFSVQLKQSEEVLGKLMKEINSMTLTPIEGIPIPGTVCLARCLEDGHICRAVVTNEVDGQFKVFYVDFGNFEVVPLEALYEIPFKFVIPKVMAIRFALAGVEKSTVTLDMQCSFKQFVDNRLIHMKVMPMTARTALPRCELWDPETQINALDIVNQAASAGYPDHISLTRGFSQAVKVSYVFSCNRFYVQLKSKQDDLMRLMLDIQVLCRDAEAITNHMVKVGLPCYALYEGDQQWYRSQVVEVLTGGQLRVHYVDYGNEEVVSTSMLKVIEGKQLTILRPQAIECCLNGYQNMEPDLERDNLLEELILEQEFTMKVIEMQGKKALIELIDSANYNVASLLLDKIAVTRSQVSPMLVQAGNKIEHRKSSQPHNANPFAKPDHRKQDRNRNSYDSNDSNENNSWRQNNKGFNKNYDRNKRDEMNDSTDSERHSTKGYGRNDRNRNEVNSRNPEGGSWKQNNRSFNKSQDRFNKDNAKSNDWGASGDERKPHRDNRQNRDTNNWGGGGDTNEAQGEDWGSAQPETRNFNKRDRDNWGGDKDGGRKNANSRNDWGNKDGESRSFNKREDWGNKDGESRSFNKREDWGNKDGERRSFQKRDDWGNKDGESRSYQKKDWGNDRRKEGDWGNSEDNNKSDKGNWGNREDRKGRDNFRSNRNRSDEGNEGWNNSDGGGFKKKPNFKREASELSSSGSEKGGRRGGFNKDNNFRNKNKPNFNNKNFDQPSNDSEWNVSSSTAIEIPNVAPSTAKFALPNVDNTQANVIISWFHNPTHFYCQIESTQDTFKGLMGDIQQAYKDRPAATAEVGAPIIGLFPEDNVLYRAEVVEKIGKQYKVYYVDFGNVSVIDKVWPVEMRFMELPAQAICCKLDGIQPAGDDWLDATNYSPYFDKQQFLCSFVSREGDKVGIKLEYENEDIAMSLVRDGLAKSALPPTPPELPLLIGQQFRAMLLSVNSLADFCISLQTGVVLNCGVFNLSTSTETWEDNLKEKIEQILIVYVDDLAEDKLEVTLYDQNGLKIKLIDNDAEAFESVELICPYLIMYSSLSGIVTHVEDNNLSIQPADCTETVEYLLNTAYQYYENNPEAEPITPVEGYAYAVKGSDTNWYRGRVVKIEDEKVTVCYADYGNSEEVEISALRELTLEFMEIPITCVSLIVPDATDALIGEYVTLNLTFTENGLEGTVQEVQPQAEIPQEPQPVVEEQLVVESQVDAAEQPPPATTSGTQVILSHTDSPSEFYLQLAESLTEIDQLQATLQEEANGMPDLDNPVTGVLCAAPYSLDLLWYRAQVLDADSDITTVRFVDYGNTDVLDNKLTKVKTLPPSLLSLEVHATKCRLKIKPVDEEWTSAACERFEQLCSVETLTAQFISQDEKTNYVELFSDGTNVREVLIQEKLALPDEELAETSIVGFVSHLNSPSEFWIQLENCVEELEWVAEQLSGAESFPELEDLSPGALCAALFPDDQMWYRARILSNTVAGLEVLFVDYGNSCTSCSLRELPEDLVMLSPLAQKCSLQKPENLTNWGPEMVRKFGEIAADGQTTFNVKKLSTGETALVELMLDGVDVISLILPQTEEVKVKSFEGLDEIVLVRGDQELETKYKLESLPDVVWNEESVKKFEEFNDNGNTVFQAEFVSDDTIRLYLGLNDIRLDLSGIKSTPVSTPMKVRSEMTHSNSTARAIVNDLLEKSINQVEAITNSELTLSSIPTNTNEDLTASKTCDDNEVPSVIESSSPGDTNEETKAVSDEETCENLSEEVKIKEEVDAISNDGIEEKSNPQEVDHSNNEQLDNHSTTTDLTLVAEEAVDDAAGDESGRQDIPVVSTPVAQTNDPVDEEEKVDVLKAEDDNSASEETTSDTADSREKVEPAEVEIKPEEKIEDSLDNKESLEIESVDGKENQEVESMKTEHPTPKEEK